MMVFRAGIFLVPVLVLVLMAAGGEGLSRRCFVCRSRGPKGDCQDPFMFNRTSLEGPGQKKGVEAAPCASTWCTKVLETSQQVDDGDYAVATERSCLNSSPPDKEERCGYVLRGGRKVFMCFCQGDLCNGSQKTKFPNVIMVVGLIFLANVIF